MSDELIPIQMEVKSIRTGGAPVALKTFSSYSFDRSVLVPAAAFRFTAPGIDKSVRLSIRSGDVASLYLVSKNNIRQPIGTGIIDESDTHIIPTAVEYLLTGRDMAGQLVDNAAVDAQNRIQNTEKITLDTLVNLLIKNTRIPPETIVQQLPNGPLLFQTRAGETRINALQRYLEFTNSLVWTDPSGRLVIGKPSFYAAKSGSLISSSTDPSKNNCLDIRVKRNLNQAIRQIVTQLQTQTQVDADSFTVKNYDKDMRDLVDKMVGRSVYTLFSYGQGSEAYNQIFQIGNSDGAPRTIGQALSLRELARENVKVLDVDVVVQGHLNESGVAYNVDQVYSVQVDDEDVNEDMYVYSCTYDLTLDHGATTHLRLCRLGAITADAAITGHVV